MQDPSEEAYDAALAVLSYLCTVHDHCIEYSRNDPSLTVWADSSWGKTPRPYGGFVIFYCGGPIGHGCHESLG